jgi:hypothetical protein
MGSPEERVFTLRIDAEAQPIEGSLDDGRRPERDFVGWLGLASALEALLSSEPEDGEGPGSAPPADPEPG